MTLWLIIAHLASMALMTLPVARFHGKKAKNDPFIVLINAKCAIIDPAWVTVLAVNVKNGTAGIYRGR